MLTLRAKVNLGAMAMKGFSAFPKNPALLEPHNEIAEGALPLWRDTVGIFNSPNQLGPPIVWIFVSVSSCVSHVTLEQFTCSNIILHLLVLSQLFPKTGNFYVSVSFQSLCCLFKDSWSRLAVCRFIFPFSRQPMSFFIQISNSQ